jgi:Holliday junction resolvase RusA-like endonuclease
MNNKENGNKMFKIEKLTMVDFGTFVGKQEVVFSTDEEKNLTVIDTEGIRSNEYIAIVNAIRNAFGLQIDRGIESTIWRLPEDYYENAKSSVNIIGSSVVNSENEFLFFYKPSSYLEGRLLNKGDEERYGFSKAGPYGHFEVSHKIPKKFLNQSVVDAMNEITERVYAFNKWGPEATKMKFLLEDGIIKTVGFAYPNEMMPLESNRGMIDWTCIIILLAFKKIFAPNSFLVINGSGGPNDHEKMKTFLMDNVSQLIFVGNCGDRGSYNSGLKDEIDVQRIGKEYLTDADDWKNTDGKYTTKDELLDGKGPVRVITREKKKWELAQEYAEEKRVEEEVKAEITKRLDVALDIFVEGKPVTFGNASTEKPWKDNIKKAFTNVKLEPIEKSKVALDFSLLPERFMRRGKQPLNDLDNLSKPVLDAMVEINIFSDDSGILDLTLRKRKSNKEGVRIRISEFSGIDSLVI